jgi:hypothetical protein
VVPSSGSKEPETAVKRGQILSDGTRR